MIHARASVLVVVLLASAGCGSTPASPTADPVPAGMMRVQADDAGLSFGIDGSWTIISPVPGADSHQFGATEPLVVPTQVPTSGSSSSYSYNLGITCNRLTGTRTVPTPEQLRAADPGIKLVIDSTTDVATPAGSGRLVVSHVRLEPRAPVAYSETLYLTVNHAVDALTASGPSASEAHRVMTATIPTLRKLG